MSRRSADCWALSFLSGLAENISKMSAISSNLVSVSLLVSNENYDRVEDRVHHPHDDSSSGSDSLRRLS